MRRLLPPAAADKALEIWFQDEARVGQKGTLAYVWARCGTRPRAVQDTRYAWAYLFGAVCPERAVGAGLVMPHADTEAMNLHLAEIGKAVAPGAHAALVLDGAGWHGSDKLVVPDNITLVKLPPYAPELNPIENVWAYLRGTKLAHRLFVATPTSWTLAVTPGTASPPTETSYDPSPSANGQRVTNYDGWYHGAERGPRDRHLGLLGAVLPDGQHRSPANEGDPLPGGPPGRIPEAPL